MPFFNPPRPIRIDADSTGRPARILWRGRWEAPRVTKAWRIDTDWWLPEDAQTKRDYYQLVLERALAVIEVFRDEIRGGWFLEKIKD